jgi:MFS family permease
MQLGAIYAIVALAGTCTQFFNPARMALIGDIVPEEHRARATGLLQTVLGIALVVGPALAAPLYFTAGVEWALLANAASFVVSFGAILLIHAPQAARSDESGASAGFLREYAAGLRFFAQSRVLMTLLITGIIIMGAVGAINALDIFFALQNLHAPASAYGYLQAAAGGGIIAGSILASVFARRIGIARMAWLSIVLVGALLLVYARLTSLVPALIMNGLIGIPNAGLNVAVGPLVLHVTRREMVGRVMSVLGPTLALFSMLSTAAAGYLDGTVLYGFHATIAGIAFGPVDTIFTVGSVLAILAGLYAMVNLRSVRLAGEAGSPSDSALSEPDEVSESSKTPALV